MRYTFIATGGISILTAGICILFIWLYVSVTVSFNSVYRDCTGGEWTFERCKPTCVKSNLEDIMKHVIEITKSSVSFYWNGKIHKPYWKSVKLGAIFAEFNSKFDFFWIFLSFFF